MASKLDVIVRKHVLPVLEKEGIDAGLREVSAIARESGYKVSGNRLYHQPSDSEKPVRESHSKLADYIKWYIKTKTACEADDIGEKPGETAAVAAAESAQPTDPLAPKAGEIKVPSEPHLPNAGTGADVPSVRLSDTFVGQIEDHLAALGITPEEQEKIDRRKTYLHQFIQEVGEGRVTDAENSLIQYVREAQEQYKSFFLPVVADDHEALSFAGDFARLACGRAGDYVARHYGDALENLLDRDKSGRIAAEAVRSLPRLYASLTSQSVDKFLTEAVQKIDEYNALPKRKRTKAAWEEVVAYFSLGAPQAAARVQELIVEEHPRLLEDIAGIRREKSIVMGKLSVARNAENHEYHRAEAIRSEAATLRGDLETVKGERNDYKNTNRVLRYLAGIALLVGGLFGGAIGESCASRSDRQAEQRQAHEMEVLQNEKTRLYDSLNERTVMLNTSRDQLQQAKSTVEKLRKESAYALDLRGALIPPTPSPAAVESIVDRYINERGQGRVVVHASTCQSAMKYLHHLMGGAAEQEDAFVRALKDSDLCKKDIKSANLYIFEP